MALAAKYLDNLSYRIYVLLGDSEMAEGSQWEALQIAARYELDNLIGILDVNRLGQRGETMCGYDIQAYQRRIGAFGWKTRAIDGHDLEAILEAFRWARRSSGRPAMIIAKTVKGNPALGRDDQRRHAVHAGRSGGSSLVAVDADSGSLERQPPPMTFRTTRRERGGPNPPRF